MIQQEFDHVKQLLEKGIKEIFVVADKTGYAVYLAFRKPKKEEEVKNAADLLKDMGFKMDIYCGTNNKCDITLTTNAFTTQSILICDVPFPRLGSLDIPSLKEKFKDEDVKVYLYIYEKDNGEKRDAGNGQEWLNDERAQFPLDISPVRIHSS